MASSLVELRDMFKTVALTAELEMEKLQLSNQYVLDKLKELEVSQRKVVSEMKELSLDMNNVVEEFKNLLAENVSCEVFDETFEHNMKEEQSDEGKVKGEVQLFDEIPERNTSDLQQGLGEMVFFQVFDESQNEYNEKGVLLVFDKKIEFEVKGLVSEVMEGKANIFVSSFDFCKKNIHFQLLFDPGGSTLKEVKGLQNVFRKTFDVEVKCILESNHMQSKSAAKDHISSACNAGKRHHFDPGGNSYRRKFEDHAHFKVINVLGSLTFISKVLEENLISSLVQKEFGEVIGTIENEKIILVKVQQDHYCTGKQVQQLKAWMNGSKIANGVKLSVFTDLVYVLLALLFDPVSQETGFGVFFSRQSEILWQNHILCSELLAGVGKKGKKRIESISGYFTYVRCISSYLFDPGGNKYGLQSLLKLDIEYEGFINSCLHFTKGVELVDTSRAKVKHYHYYGGHKRDVIFQKVSKLLCEFFSASLIIFPKASMGQILDVGSLGKSWKSCLKLKEFTATEFGFNRRKHPEERVGYLDVIFHHFIKSRQRKFCLVEVGDIYRRLTNLNSHSANHSQLLSAFNKFLWFQDHIADWLDHGKKRRLVLNLLATSCKLDIWTQIMKMKCAHEADRREKQATSKEFAMTLTNFTLRVDQMIWFTFENYWECLSTLQKVALLEYLDLVNLIKEYENLHARLIYMIAWFTLYRLIFR